MANQNREITAGALAIVQVHNLAEVINNYLEEANPALAAADPNYFDAEGMVVVSKRLLVHTIAAATTALQPTMNRRERKELDDELLVAAGRLFAEAGIVAGPEN